MDVVIRLGVRFEMHWPLFSIGTLQLNSSPTAVQPVDTVIGGKCYFERGAHWHLDSQRGVVSAASHNGVGVSYAHWHLCYVVILSVI